MQDAAENIEQEKTDESFNDQIVTEPEIENVESNTDESHGESTENNGQNESDEVIVSIGDEKPQEAEEEAKAPNWVRELRKTNTELKKKNRELEQKLRGASDESQAPTKLGKKPSLEEFDYDTDKFEIALESWYETKRKVEEESEKARRAQEDQQKAWQAKLNEYGESKANLKVKDFEFAEEVVQEFFDVTQQGVMLQGAENPALVVYALGKNPKKAKEISSIKDPVKFAFAVAKLETQLKVTNRKAAPPPEKTVKGTGSLSGAVDSTLERLREEAAKTGNMSKVIAYKAQLRKKSN